MQFVLLSDHNADDFVGLTSVPIFEDPSPGRVAWELTEPGAAKHDTFVYSAEGVRTLVWDADTRDLGDWSADVRAAVEALGK